MDNHIDLFACDADVLIDGTGISKQHFPCCLHTCLEGEKERITTITQLTCVII